MDILLISYYEDYGRNGKLEGKFIITEELWNEVQGLDWYTSGVLGKYSEVSGTIGNKQNYKIKKLPYDQFETLCEIFDIEKEDFQVETLSGFNPIYHLVEEWKEKIKNKKYQLF